MVPLNDPPEMGSDACAAILFEAFVMYGVATEPALVFCNASEAATSLYEVFNTTIEVEPSVLV